MTDGTPRRSERLKRPSDSTASPKQRTTPKRAKLSSDEQKLKLSALAKSGVAVDGDAETLTRAPKADSAFSILATEVAVCLGDAIPGWVYALSEVIAECVCDPTDNEWFVVCGRYTLRSAYRGKGDIIAYRHEDMSIPDHLPNAPRGGYTLLRAYDAKRFFPYYTKEEWSPALYTVIPADPGVVIPGHSARGLPILSETKTEYRLQQTMWSSSKDVSRIVDTTITGRCIGPKRNAVSSDTVPRIKGVISICGLRRSGRTIQATLLSRSIPGSIVIGDMNYGGPSYRHAINHAARTGHTVILDSHYDGTDIPTADLTIWLCNFGNPDDIALRDGVSSDERLSIVNVSANALMNEVAADVLSVVQAEGF